MVRTSDISVILQGPVREETRRAVQSVRSFLPGAEIILSTWLGEVLEDLGDDVRLVQATCPKAFVQHEFFWHDRCTRLEPSA